MSTPFFTAANNWARLLFTAGFPLLLGGMASAQRQTPRDTYPRIYVVNQCTTAPAIDGIMRRKEWRKANWSQPFLDIEGPSKPPPAYRTRMKMQWDLNFLYLLVEVEEPHLWATLDTADAIIYQDHDVEVFLDPDGDGDRYLEIEINALGTVLDLFMDKPYKKRGIANLEWNVTGLKKAVGLKGTLNDNRDRDRGWMVEMAIPMQSIQRSCRVGPPAEGTVWRINFSRVEWLMDPAGIGYKKRTGADGKRLPEQNWVWSPQGVIDMHIPENWGYLHFKE
ncbi:MAG: hypothetical protein RL732_680 [Bacteroidota bacterium]